MVEYPAQGASLRAQFLEIHWELPLQAPIDFHVEALNLVKDFDEPLAAYFVIAQRYINVLEMNPLHLARLIQIPQKLRHPNHRIGCLLRGFGKKFG